jgi:conjugal transfer pilus assembly protein TraL
LDEYSIPKHLDDPELIGFWTLDEFLIMLLPFVWGILSQHILFGLFGACGCWYGYRKLKAGRGMSWVIHKGYWLLPSRFFGVRGLPPSHVRNMVG